MPVRGAKPKKRKPRHPRTLAPEKPLPRQLPLEARWIQDRGGYTRALRHQRVKDQERGGFKPSPSALRALRVVFADCKKDLSPSRLRRPHRRHLSLARAVDRARGRRR